MPGDAKAGASLPAENSRQPPLPDRTGCGPIAVSKAVARFFPIAGAPAGCDDESHLLPRFSLCRQRQKAGSIQRIDLDPDIGPKRRDAEVAEIVVEVLEHRRERDRLDAGSIRPFDQS